MLSNKVDVPWFNGFPWFNNGLRWFTRLTVELGGGSFTCRLTLGW